MNWQAHLHETAAHLRKMAATPGWRKYAETRRDELLANPMYSGLVQVLEEMRRETTPERTEP